MKKKVVGYLALILAITAVVLLLIALCRSTGLMRIEADSHIGARHTV